MIPVTRQPSFGASFAYKLILRMKAEGVAVRTRSRTAVSLVIAVSLYAHSGLAFAAESRAIEEIIITAQRVAEPARKVPIAVSAFTEAMIRDRQIISLADLQINIPNVTTTPRAVSSAANLRIRGIGWQDLGDGGETPSSTHLNEIPFPQSFTSVEFYDLERIELMRGPQGTLYGRNATGGALNLVTRRPSFDGVVGYADIEFGDYDHKRFTGALNVPVTDALAFRVAGTALQRDGYIENKAGGQIPGVDDDLDGRDYYAVRVTGAWKITDQVNLWVMYDRLDESSNRVWRAPAVCKQSALPVLGCEPNEFGRDLPHPGTSPTCATSTASWSTSRPSWSTRLASPTTQPPVRASHGESPFSHSA